MARRGRLPKLTPDVQRVIMESVAAGVPMKYAAMRAGVGARTVERWKAKGRAAKSGPYAAFVAAIKRAEADAVVRNVAIIQKAAADSWQAAAWFLERRTEEFVRREPQPDRRPAEGRLVVIRAGVGVSVDEV